MCLFINTMLTACNVATSFCKLLLLVIIIATVNITVFKHHPVHLKGVVCSHLTAVKFPTSQSHVFSGEKA